MVKQNDSWHVRAATAENCNWRNQLPKFLRHYRTTMSLLLKPSQAGKCESVSLKDRFHSLIPLHPHIPEWCRMTALSPLYFIFTHLPVLSKLIYTKHAR